jgi:hypothetical protein
MDERHGLQDTHNLQVHSLDDTEITFASASRRICTNVINNYAQ